MRFSRIELIAGFIVVISAIGIGLSTAFGLGVGNAVQAVSSIALSALLLVLYYRQTEILSRQEELMRLEQEPVLVYDRYKPEGDGVRVWLSNSGRGTAIDLRLQLEIQLPEGEILSTPSDNSPLSRKEDEIWQSSSPLHYNQTEVEYYGIPVVEIEDTNGNLNARRFRPTTEILASRGIREIKFRLSIQYSSEIGSEETIQLRALHEVEFEEALTLEEAVNRSRQYPYDHSRWRDNT